MASPVTDLTFNKRLFRTDPSSAVNSRLPAKLSIALIEERHSPTMLAGRSGRPVLSGVRDRIWSRTRGCQAGSDVLTRSVINYVGNVDADIQISLEVPYEHYSKRTS
jgi:hypothetical protein